MATLFEVVGRRHGVASRQVREAAGHRGWTFDVLTLGSLAAGVALVSARVIRRIFSGPLANSRPALVLALAFASIALAIVGFGAGSVWSGIAETFRLGNGHGSYRVDRIPLRQHPLSMFTAAVVLFWLMAAYHFWSDARSDA